jgi:hypothetical protein
MQSVQGRLPGRAACILPEYSEPLPLKEGEIRNPALYSDSFYPSTVGLISKEK